MGWFGKRESSTQNEAHTHCSFCNRTRAEVSKLVAGEGVSICDQCIHASLQVMRDEATTSLPSTGLDMAALRQHLDEHVIGHAAAKTALMGAMQLHVERARAEERPDWRSPRILLVGPAGCGKSTLLHAWVTATQLPAQLMHVTRLSESGYVGDDVENVLGGLLRAASDDVQLAEAGLIGLEGLNQLVPPSDEDPRRVTRLVTGRAVQRELLRLLDGPPLEAVLPGTARHPQWGTMALSCAGLMVVFTATVADPPAEEHELRSVLLEQGVLPDVLARLDRVVVMQRRSSEELLDVLLDERGPLVAMQVNARALGAELEVVPAAAALIAHTAARHPAGAWTLRRPLLRFFEQILADPQPARRWRLDAEMAEALLD